MCKISGLGMCDWNWTVDGSARAAHRVEEVSSAEQFRTS